MRTFDLAPCLLALATSLSFAACKQHDDRAPAPASPPAAPTPTATAGSQAATPPANVSDAQRARAAALVGELKKSLTGAVTAALAQGAPEAIEACHAMAPALTDAVAREGAKIGRATRKPRNPGNAASGWQADALAHFEKLHADRAPLAGQSFARVLDDGRVAYAEPLVIQEVCLTCHGTSVAPEVTAAIAPKYPDDQATGYALGDLRGIAWVELPPN